MQQFVHNPDVEALPDGRLRLLEPITEHFFYGIQNAHLTLTVPAGFESDGASIPRILWPVIGPPIRSGYLVPALFHDYLCEHVRTYNERVLADAIFFELLARYNVPAQKRVAMYLGVRWYGRFIWRRKAGET